MQWGDIDFMYEKQIFTVDKATYANLSVFVNSLHNDSMKYVIIVVSTEGHSQAVQRTNHVMILLPLSRHYALRKHAYSNTPRIKKLR